MPYQRATIFLRTRAMGVSALNALQLCMVAALVAGGLLRQPWLSDIAAALVLLATLWQWRQLILMARLLVVGSIAVMIGMAIWYPETLPRIETALIQGAGFSGLMTVLGLLRHPVRQSALVRAAAEYLITRPPRRRFGAIKGGAHVLAILFNVGIIPMIGDLIRGDEKTILDPSRRALIIGAQRGMALMTIWSPVGLGFAIVTASVSALNPLVFLVVGMLFTALTLIVTTCLPLLPPEAALLPEDVPPVKAPIRPLILTFGVCGALLVVTVLLHQLLHVSFMIASVTVLPIFALAWLTAERSGTPRSIPEDIRIAIGGLGGLRNESAIFISANVIGTVISIFLAGLPLGEALNSGALPALPVMLFCMMAVPVASMAYVPNTIGTVLVAQMLGSSPIGQAHPLALALALAVGWALASSVSPISAMCLMGGAICGVSSSRFALVWNRNFAILVLFIASLAVTLLSLL